jgi:hypothetical protein
VELKFQWSYCLITITIHMTLYAFDVLPLIILYNVDVDEYVFMS